MAKKEPVPPGATRVEGTDGWITFDGRYVTIKHRWHADCGAGESSYPLASVSGVNVKTKLLLASMTVLVAGGAAYTGRGDPLTVNGFQKQEALLFRDLVVKARAALYEDLPPSPPAAPAPPPPAPVPTAPGFVSVPASVPEPTSPAAPELVEQIRQLAAFHAQGVLNDAEFAAAKSRLLGTGEPHDEAPRHW